MKETYAILRALVALLGASALLGVAWFTGSINQLTTRSGLLIGLASIAVACMPQRMLSNIAARVLVVSLCIVGVASGSLLMVSTFTPGAAEWDVVAMNLSHVLILAAMAAIAIKNPSE